MSLEDFEPSVENEVDQVKDQLAVSNSLELEAEGHNNGVQITDSLEISGDSQKTEELTVNVGEELEADTVRLLIICKNYLNVGCREIESII